MVIKKKKLLVKQLSHLIFGSGCKNRSILGDRCLILVMSAHGILVGNVCVMLL